MDSARFQLVMDLFQQACDVTGGARDEFLRQACAGDAELRREVELLLAADSQSPGMRTPIAAGDGARVLAVELARDELGGDGNGHGRLPQRLGSYRITAKIGEGGMGVVYRAVQENPQREVALKALKSGIATPATLRRFEHEALVLGWLQHQGIARIYEAHTAEAGDGSPPFISMEFVRGASLSEFLKNHRPAMALRERLRLFVRICEAVAYAHQRGIIHRDLKPSNIMVDESGQPKILDFGVARLLDADLQSVTLHTRAGEVIGTLAYMSPEQVAGDNKDVDTRSDVYSLGVILYEMLTGRRPHQLDTLSWMDAARVVRESPLTPPSTHNTAVRGDLETIVCKALARDKSRRYQSAAELSADIERYLANEPISARRDSTWYVFRKTLVRHRTAAAFAAILALTIVGSTVALGFMYRGQGRALRAAKRQTERADRALGEARVEAARADAINDFLLGMLSSADPAQARGRDITLRELLDNAAAEIDENALADQPATRAAILSTIGRIYSQLGRFEQAEPHLVEALEIQRKLHEGDHADVAAAIHQLGSLAHARGDFATAEERLGEALAMRRRIMDPDHLAIAESLIGLASVKWGRDQFKPAEEFNREALRIRRLRFGEEHPAIAQALHNLALSIRAQGRHEEAIEIYREALAMRRRVLSENHPDTVFTLNNLGWLYFDLDRLDEAEPLLREALETRRRILPAGHPHLALSLNNYSQLLRKQGRLREALPLAQEALEIQRRLGDDAHPHVLANTHTNLGRIFMMMDDAAAAEPHYREAVAINSRLWGRDYHRTMSTLNSFAGALVAQKKFDEARPVLAEIIEHERAASEKPDASVKMLNACAWRLLTCEVEDLRNPAAALPLAVRAAEMTQNKDADILDTLALAYSLTGDATRAIEAQKAALAILADGDERRGPFEERLRGYEDAGGRE